MANFPSITPSSRNFKPGVYPQKSYRTLSGANYRRTFGTMPYGASLDLEFENITDANAEAIVVHYRNQTSTNKRFRLSSNATSGMGGSLGYYADGLADNLRWEYAGPPEIRSVRPGRSTLRVSLLGEIRNPATDDA